MVLHADLVLLIGSNVGFGIDLDMNMESKLISSLDLALGYELDLNRNLSSMFVVFTI